jgi:hypothetical protein
MRQTQKRFTEGVASHNSCPPLSHTQGASPRYVQWREECRRLRIALSNITQGNVGLTVYSAVPGRLMRRAGNIVRVSEARSPSIVHEEIVELRSPVRGVGGGLRREAGNGWLITNF